MISISLWQAKKMTHVAVVCVAIFFSHASFALDHFDVELMNGTEAGSRFKSSDHPDAVFVLDAFQLNCGPCRQNAPNIESLARFYSYEPRVQVVDVGIDTVRVNFTNWIRQMQPGHPVVMDADRTIWKSLRGTGTPTTWLVDCKLNVRWSHVGVFSPETQKEISTKIDELLEEKCDANNFFSGCMEGIEIRNDKLLFKII